MRGWTIVLIITGAILAWLVLVAIGPQTIKEESVFWDMGLIFLIMGLGSWVADLYLYKYTHHIDWPGFNTTLFQVDPIDMVELPATPGSNRSNVFYLYALGGTRIGPLRGGGEKGFLWANEDLIKRDKGDLVNVHIRSVPDLYRHNYLETDYEHPIESLPSEMLTRLQQRKDFKHNTPVYVAWDPLEIDELDDVVKEKLSYKNLYELKNQENQTLTNMLQSLGSASSSIAKSSALAAQTFKPSKEGKKNVFPSKKREEDE